MKLSELIKHAQEALDEHGDLPVIVSGVEDINTKYIYEIIIINEGYYHKVHIV